MTLNNNVDLSLLKGMTFTFTHLQQVIVLKVSALTGKEAVYINNKLVSQARNIKTHTVHECDHEGIAYRIELHVDSLLKGNITCSLTADEQPVTTYELSYDKRKGKPLIELPLLVLVGAGLGVGMSYGVVTHWMAWMCIGVTMVWAAKKSRKQWVCRERCFTADLQA